VSAQVAPVLSILFALSELGLAIFRRAGRGTARAAGGAPWLIYGVVTVSITLGFFLAGMVPQLELDPAGLFRVLGAALFAAGVAVRWWAIIYLGRFFTVNVAIAADHRLVDGRPYRYLRHPSYAGSLMIIAGLGLALCNWGALAAMLIPSLLVFLRRMRIEEQALIRAFGDQYRDYMRRTKRLIPAVY
jgi:protein-S-isoprenylcysteine O-methyltransferase